MSNGLYTSPEKEDQNRRYLEQLRQLELGKGMDPIFDEDESSWLTDFTGNLLWGGTSSASWGALDVAALTETGKDVRSGLALGTYRPWEEQTGAGKAGFILGQGLGMFATFSWTGKGLGLLSGLATKKSANPIATQIAKKAGTEAVAKYGEKKSIQSLAKYGDKLIRGEVDDLAMEGLERGTLEAMREATKIVRSPGYKRLWKMNQEAYTKAVDDMSGVLLREMPDMGAESALKLSDNLISSAMKYSTHQFHNYMDAVVGLGAQVAAKAPGAVGRASQWTLTGKTGKLLSAMASDAMLGFTHHMAQAAIENVTYKTVDYFGAEFDNKELKHFENLNSGFMDVLINSGQSGLWMSLIAPTRFIKGGRTTKLTKEARAGLNTLRKAWKPADRMSRDQARSTLQFIDDVSEGSLKKTILSKELAGKEIENLTREEAVSMLKTVRKGFSREWLGYMGREMRQDITGSAGRMVAGALAMNLPAMKQYYDDTGQFSPIGALGADPSEIVSNMIVGMLFAKSGRTFGEGGTSRKQSRLFETGEMKQYYTANVEKIKAIRLGLESMGFKSGGEGLNINDAVTELRGRYLINTGDYKIVDDILRDKFVVAEDSPVIERAKPLGEAYESVVDVVGDPVARGKLDIAMKVIEHYDNNSTDIGNVMREVLPVEALDIVNRINEIPGIRENQSFPEIWLQKIKMQAGWTANEKFYDLQLGNAKGFYESIGVTNYSYDPSTGILRVPQVNFDKLLGSRPSETLHDFKNTMKKFLDEGDKSKKVFIEGRLPREKEVLEDNDLKAIETSYQGYVALMNESVRGRDSMVFDKGIMHDNNMWMAYNVTNADIDINNMLRMFTDVKQDKLFTNLSKEDVELLQVQIESLQLNRSRMPTVSEKDIIETGADQKRFDDLTKFYARIQNVYNILTGNKNLNVSVDKDITFDTIAGARNELENKMGDVIMNDPVYERLLNQSVDHMVNTLDIQSLGRNHQLKHSLLVMMNGGVAPSGTSVGDLNKYGGLVVRRENQIQIPDADTLFGILKSSPDLQKENLDSLREYYADFQEGIAAASGPMNITVDSNAITELISNAGGPSNVRGLLNIAKRFSQVGHIKDLFYGYDNLTEYMDKIKNDSDIYFHEYTNMADFDAATSKNLKELIHHMGTLRADIKHLMDTRNYEALINIKLEENSSLMESLERFKNIDLMDVIDKGTGNIVDIQYKQDLVDVIKRTRDLLGNNLLNEENISSYINEQISKSEYNIYSGEHTLRMNTTPQKFESDYGVPAADQEIIINNALGGKNVGSSQLTNKKILNSVIGLYREAVQRQLEIFQDTEKVTERLTDEQLYNDAWQLTSARAFSGNIKRVKYIGGYDGGVFWSDEVGYPVQSQSDGRGVTGLKNILFESREGWYVLQPDMKFLTEGQEVAKDLVIFDKDVLATIDSQIENGLGIDSKTVRNQYHRQTLEKRLEEVITANKVPMVRVILDERTQIVVGKELAQASISRAYGEDGALSNLVRTIHGADRQPEATTFLERFRTPNMNVDLLKEGINEAWNILNSPFLMIPGAPDLPRTIELDYMKRRKLADISKGKILDSRYHEALTEFYEFVSEETNSPLARELADAYNSIRDADGNLIPMRSISINDSGEELSVISRFRKRLDTYDEDMMAGIDRPEVEAFIEGISKEGTDSASFLTKKEFLMFLGTFAPSRDLVQFNQLDEVIGFNVGAMKPKGVDVFVGEDGSVRVSYDKTAFFYNPKIGQTLEDAGLSEVKFKSGNKINVSRTGTGELTENYVAPVTRRGDVEARSMEEIVEWTIEASKDQAQEIPRSSYDLTQVSVPHTGTVGANTGVHYSNRSGLHDWTQIGRHTDEFNELLSKSQDSPEALTGIGRNLSDMARAEGDLNPVRTGLDAFLDSEGLVVTDWMGDLIVDNLFSRYFQGSKIASREVGGSSNSPMAPFLADQNVDLPLIYTDGDNIGRQRIYGGFGIESDLAQMPFKALGRSTKTETTPNGDSNRLVTGFFIGRHKFYNPVVRKVSKSEFVIIPNEDKGFTVMVEGMELKKDGTFVDIVKGEIDPALLPEQQIINRRIYRTIEGDVKELRTFWEDGGVTNEKMLDKLALTDNMWMGVMNIRQPRNAYDVVINKVHRENLGSEEVPNWKHYDEREGNSTRQNSVDVLRQDSDHDFDKSVVHTTSTLDFIKEVATMAGAQVTNDPLQYSGLIIKNLEFSLRDQASMREWFKDFNNTSALRGRFMKLHQIATYLSNAIGEGGTLGTININNKKVLIKMKSRKDYVDVVGNISKTVKYFLDNYKDIVDVRTEAGFTPGIDKFVRDILFGAENVVRGNKTSVFEGLFEFVGVGEKPEVNERLLNGSVGGELLSETLYNQIVSPLNRYLAFNRGELTQADIKSKLTLKDVHRGWSDIRDTFFIKPRNRDKIFDPDGLKLDLTNGKNLLYDFLTVQSNNPFDVAMASLSSAYDTGIKVKRHGGHLQTNIENLIFKGESKTLELGGMEGLRSTSRQILKMVKNEGSLAKLAIISDRLASLQGELARLQANQYSNQYDVDKIAKRVDYYSELKTELELLVASKIAVDRLENVFRFSQGRDERTQTAFGEDWVVWDSKGENIKQVIREGETNELKILKGDIIVRGGKKFEFHPPKRQDRMREKWIAYGKPQLEMVTEDGRMVAMDQIQYDGFVIPAYIDFSSQYAKVGREWGVHRDGETLATQRKALLNMFMNDIGNRYGLSDPLTRRAFLFKLMTPELDNSTYVVKESNGKHSYDYKFTENEKISKTVYSYLADIIEGQAFSRDQSMTKIEAKNIILELSRKHALAYYGLTDPYSTVNIPFTRTASYLGKVSKRLVDIDKNILRPTNVVQGKEHEFNSAISMINQFINGDRLITPFDMARISRKIVGTRGGTNMFTIGESGNSNPVLVRKAGVRGSEPKQTVDQLLDDMAKRRRFCGAGKP
jgi:hypothetical protein